MYKLYNKHFLFFCLLFVFFVEFQFILVHVFVIENFLRIKQNITNF